MKIPLRFKSAIEQPPAELPDYAWLSYAVCAIGGDACGWSGWLLDGVFRRSAERQRTSTGDAQLPEGGEQVCPRCGKDLFRTDFGRKLETSPDQEPVWQVGKNFETSGDVEYE